jgi:hypothetical protein
LMTPNRFEMCVGRFGEPQPGEDAFSIGFLKQDFGVVFAGSK